MRVDKTCKTCGFDSNGVCGMYSTCKEDEECDDWEASLEYYTEITKKHLGILRDLMIDVK